MGRRRAVGRVGVLGRAARAGAGSGARPAHRPDRGDRDVDGNAARHPRLRSRLGTSDSRHRTPVTHGDPA